MLETLTHPKTPENSVPFDQLNSEDYPAAVDEAIRRAKKNVAKIETEKNPNFKNTIEALEVSSKDLDRVTSVFFNLYQACTDDTIDANIGPISEKLAEYGNDVQLSEPLFQNIKKVYESADKETLNREQKKLLQETFESFARNGALLNETQKETLREIDREMASLTPIFSQNLLKATHAFVLNITDEAVVATLPESVKESAREEAQNRKQEGYTFTLQAPSYIPFMKYMDDRNLREKMWLAYNSKALEGEFSNRENCQRIAQLRLARAQLLGFPTHADFVLQKRMAKTPQTALQFINQLKSPSLNAAKKELEELKAFIKNTLKENIELQSWDVAYYSEKLKKHLYDLNDEDLRPYFPLAAVINGVFVHGEKLYGLKFKKDQKIPVYHPDVEAYRVEKGGEFVGLLYLDIFPRENKKSGAWMTNFREQGFDGEKVNRPHVSIVCNFTKPTKDAPSLLTFNEVQTLFHEFGHSLHSLLSNCHYTSLSGTNVLWDFVELPSQIMENWTHEKESLDLFAKHYETGEKIPSALIDKLKKSQNFQAGLQSLRQITFSLVDFAWHTDLDAKDLDPIALEKVALQGLELLPKIPNTNFSVGFSHIFAGGYSAGYYSYKWAEVLDADAFEAFKEKGIFDPTVANRFYQEILSRGGVDDPAELFRKFRGRDPDITPLLKRSALL